MSEYKVASGHNQQNDVEALAVQPWSTAIDYRAPRQFASSGAVHTQGVASAELVFDFLTEGDLSTLDTALGVSMTTPSSDITIYMRGNDGTFGYYNARVIRPNIQRADDLLYHNVRYLLTDLEAITAP